MASCPVVRGLCGGLWVFGIRVIPGEIFATKKGKTRGASRREVSYLAPPGQVLKRGVSKKAQARRCPRRCSLSSLSIIPLAVVVVEGVNCATES